MEMQPDDKRRMDEELNEQAGFASRNSDRSIIKGEHDLDDLVHQSASGSVKENEETDADDAVHQKPFSKPDQPSEADPDDLVHEG